MRMMGGDPVEGSLKNGRSIRGRRIMIYSQVLEKAINFSKGIKITGL